MLEGQGAEVVRAASPEEAVRPSPPSCVPIICPPACASVPTRCSRRFRGGPHRRWRVFGPAEPGPGSLVARRRCRRGDRDLVPGFGGDNPTTLAFLPEQHTILIRAGDIVGAYEDAFDVLRAATAKARSRAR